MKQIYMTLLGIIFTLSALAQSAGDIVITEFMQNPAAVGDDVGEYFEVYNTTDTDIDLINWIISDLGSDSHTIATNIIVPAGAYAVLGINTDTNVNGGVTIDYAYGSDITLGNGTDELLLTAPNAVVIDQIIWDNGATFPDASGASASLNPDILDATSNDDGSNWCESTSTYGDGDLGTPGGINDVCGATCPLQTSNIVATCDAVTNGVDSYTTTIDFSGGATEAYTITVSAGALGGDDANTTADGTFIISGVEEGTDVVLTVSSATCDFSITINSPTCIAADCVAEGSVIFTEIMQNPSINADPAGEYVELYNTTDASIDLEGFVLKDDVSTGETHTIASSLIIPAQGYVVIGNGATPNGGVTLDYDYANDISLGNGTDGVILECQGGIIDQVVWDDGATFPDPSGASMELAASAYNSTDNDLGVNWGEATTSFGDGDLGTPGEDNSFTLSIIDVNSGSFSLYPNPALDGSITVEAKENTALTVQIYDLLGKEVVRRTLTSGQINVSNLSSGIYMVKVSQNGVSSTQKLVVK
ncbi:hypothetical protein GCM10009117_16380 [Gangjinia marincola]|uniref:LTD domain-containing protein n=1 Tax=Gangjinia marincola TaxID=578463 RepID=A0ABN1MH51_9FLAO